MICPTPEKFKHLQRGTALKHLSALRFNGKDDPALHVYRCGDHFHVGRQPLKYRIQDALRRSHD